MDEVSDLLRGYAPQVLAALVRRYGHFDSAEDAVQEALLAAATQWPEQGLPDDPRAWLITVAARRLTDLLRAEEARRRRELSAARCEDPPVDRPSTSSDDTLSLLLLCCHPALTPDARVALTLRAAGGLSTAEIARAFLVSETTMGKRITRAKKAIRDSGAIFAPPSPADRPARLAAVLHVLYLIFTEGYAATSGADLYRIELSGEAIRLTRLLHRLLPADGEVGGLLALMLLTDARRPARTGLGGALIPMADQDRRRWDTDLIAEGIALLTATLPQGVPGPYQLQAAIAALHDEAPTYADTDWPQIALLYERLLDLVENPVIALNHAVAVAMSRGPEEGLALVAEVAADPRLAMDHRVHAVRAHLLETAGDADGARAAYLAAAEQATSLPQQRYLRERAARLT
ncbi:sigma-70 family RNA polymerase sigma factor [Nocardia panacis]|uniref:Sigma-70 family RNA polymerase sigma factor n=1 Tax=Nocardia panacis TaxID=2340916 RepID=A0A3A4KTL5_9NOCA|nr:sigma-70 family RNA polymerase sigma factor [Nocardia panacis]RJO78385.1 sigma-70 family RNA polymerase sigma factor [Nocardia panacis]